MNNNKNSVIDQRVKEEYKYGFITEIESDTLAPGISEETIHFISKKKKEPSWLLEWRLKAYRKWLKMKCIVSSLIPGASVSDSISVIKPYLYSSLTRWFITLFLLLFINYFIFFII